MHLWQTRTRLSVFSLLLISLALILLVSCAERTPSQENSTFETTPSSQEKAHTLSGGAATVFSATASTFEKHSSNLQDPKKIRDFNIGNDFFKNPWIPSRSSTSMRDGLGPLFNNNACQDCHIRDGRGHAPSVSDTEDGTDFSSMLIRTAKSTISSEERQAMLDGKLANVGDSKVGSQLQQHALPEVTPEASLQVSYETKIVRFSDGHTVELLKPRWHLHSASGFDDDTIFSPRVAPPMIGLGLLELIPKTAILANQDVIDKNRDGISGKANFVWSIESQKVTLGRFGWKAGQPSVKEQTAGAFLGDMGLTSKFHPTENCLPHQQKCLIATNGNGDSNHDYAYEVSDLVLEKVSFYSSHLAVPSRRNVDSESVNIGERLFEQAGCTDCHIKSWMTGESQLLPELSSQLIYPYTDMLLHNMGPDLTDFTIDNEAVLGNTLFEYAATTDEWRTPPLWGLGLTKTVSPKATFLHDGRARSVIEAILWHGGEAEKSRDHVLQFNPDQRNQLLSFLNSL